MSEARRSLTEVLVECSPSGILVTGQDGRVRMVNPALRAMLPVVPNPIGRSPLDAVPVPALARAIAGEDEVKFSLASGNKDLLVHVVSLDDGGRLAILQDVTSLRRAERYRSEFVANVSHELRTPATAIAGYAETLLDDRDRLDPSVVEMVEIIRRNAARLTALFDDLLHLARIDAREGPLPMTCVALAPVVAECVDKLRVAAERKDVTVQVFVPESFQVLANRDALLHVIGNLVDNAIKYSHQGGVVTVRARPRDGHVLLEVIDVGIGIDPVHHDRIFERFYRVDRGRSRTAGGTGLGLAIVKRLLDAMDATIELRSRPGRGSVFRVRLKPYEVLE